MTPPSPLLTVPESCAYLRIGRTTLYRAVAGRRLRVTKVEGRTMLRVSELERYLDRRTREAR
jgi:excisionase family DNA binding protein